jgi:hypothetical protein
MKKPLADFAFFAMLIFLSLLLFGSGCGTLHRIAHPFSPVAIEQAAAPGPAPEPAPTPIPVKLAGGQVVLMVPATAKNVSEVSAHAKPTPVKSALSKLLVLVWIAGLLCIAAGVALIVWASQLWLGLKLIGCSVGGIICAEWFYVHYVGTIAVFLIAGAAWIVLDHLVTWSAVAKWLHKQEDSIKKNL